MSYLHDNVRGVRIMGNSLVVELPTLDRATLVRIQVPQPIWLEYTNDTLVLLSQSITKNVIFRWHKS